MDMSRRVESEFNKLINEIIDTIRCLMNTIKKKALFCRVQVKSFESLIDMHTR